MLWSMMLKSTNLADENKSYEYQKKTYRKENPLNPLNCHHTVHAHAGAGVHPSVCRNRGKRFYYNIPKHNSRFHDIASLIGGSEK